MSRARAEDPQADRLYEMEAVEFSFMRRHRCALKDLVGFNRIFCTMAEVPLARIQVVGPSSRDWVGRYDPQTFLIELDGRQGLNGGVFAHELAHHLTFNLHPRAQDHGPLFARRYGQLLDLMRLFPLPGFRAICRKYGVRIAKR